MAVSIATAPVYICATVFVLCTAAHAPALARKISSIFRARAPELSRSLSAAHSIASTRTTVSRMSSVAGWMSGAAAGGAPARDPSGRRSRYSRVHGERLRQASAVTLPAGLPLEQPPRIWGFPHLDTDSTATLIKRAVLWEAACAACTAASLVVSTIGAHLLPLKHLGGRSYEDTGSYTRTCICCVSCTCVASHRQEVEKHRSAVSHRCFSWLRPGNSPGM